MARPVKIRSDYDSDALFLSRLAKAVEGDTKQTQAWRDETSHHIRSAMARLLQASVGNGESSQAEPQEK